MLVPIDNADAFEAALQTLAPEDRMRYETHVVEKRETLASIAKQYGTSAAVLAKINDLRRRASTPARRSRFRRSACSCRTRCCSPRRASIARRPTRRPQAASDRLPGAGRRDLEQHRPAPWHAGEHAGPPQQPRHRRKPLIKGQRLVIKASARRYRDEGIKSGRRTLYTVRRGDTVFSISRQFQVSVTQLKSWNGLNKHHQIRAGQRLVMYIDSSHQQG